MRFAHVINPVAVTDSSDLFVAQPITFESMRIAQQKAAGQVGVELLSVGYEEDKRAMPAGFQALPVLTRSVLDVADFREQRKLPLLWDILERLYSGSDAEFLIYTNVDIGLQPGFYLAVERFISQGFDAFVINRRTIAGQYTSLDQMPLMIAEKGSPHRGWDCFVFRRTLFPRFKLFDICVGATRVGLALLANMVGYGSSFKEFKHEYLTFHIGDERNWLNPAYADYDAHNTKQLMAILAAIEEEIGPFGRDTIPGSFYFRKRTFGPLYEFWARHFYVPVGLSRVLNRLMGRR